MRRRLRSWLQVLVLALGLSWALTGSASPLAPPALTADDLGNWLDGLMPFALQRGDVAGAVVVVVKGGKILVQRGYGYADVAARKRVDPATTLFRVGSISKVFTWTAVMQQVERRRIDLDADINLYLDFRVPPYRGRPVTMRNLMTHTSGFDETDDCILSPHRERSPSLAAVARHCLPPRVYPAGEVPAYSNYATTLAGYIVQRVSGEPFEAYVERHIFAPLGMVHASFRQPLPAALLPDMSRGYESGSGPARPFEIAGVVPAGALALSGADMARFMTAHLHNGVLGDGPGGGRILADRTARMMHDTPFTVFTPAIPRMRLGFFEENANGHRAIEHGGDTNLFHAGLWLLLDDDVGLFVSLNSLGNPSNAAGIRAGLFRQFVDRYFPQLASHKPSVALPLAVTRRDAALVAGNYESSRRSVDGLMAILQYVSPIEIQADGQGRLIFASHPASKYREIAPQLWADDEGKLMAAKIVDGRVALLSSGNSDALTPRPAVRDPRLLTLAIAIGLVALALWPAAAILRHRFGIPFALSGRAALSYRLSRGMVGGAALLLSVWLLTMVAMLETFALTSAMNPWLRTLDILSALLFPAAFVCTGWEAWTVWTTGRGGAGVVARLWSLAMLLGAALLLWIAIDANLLSFTVKY